MKKFSITLGGPKKYSGIIVDGLSSSVSLEALVSMLLSCKLSGEMDIVGPLGFTSFLRLSGICDGAQLAKHERAAQAFIVSAALNDATLKEFCEVSFKITSSASVDETTINKGLGLDDVLILFTNAPATELQSLLGIHNESVLTGAAETDLLKAVYGQKVLSVLASVDLNELLVDLENISETMELHISSPALASVVLRLLSDMDDLNLSEFDDLTIEEVDYLEEV